ncbi:MAG: MarR family transcriptional regulator [Halodesulfurarchaeum sp.]|nr:MarR family transcriptional regulator [Halodesulfurarchaeum sp.]
MNRRMADLLVAGIAGLVLLLGAVWSFQAAQQPSTMMDGTMGSMMDGSMGTYGTDPLVYLLGGVILAVVIAGGYLVVRDQIARPAESATRASNGVPAAGPMGETADSRPETGPVESPGAPATEGAESANRGSDPVPERELLRYLPDDERRVLEPVIDSPGVTQIEIRDRSDFSKSKVSQTLSELEKRGLVYKEKQGRTFRVYPGEELDEAESA